MAEKSVGNEDGPKSEHLHIFVNRKKFEEADGVKPQMTGAEIAALVGLSPDQARVFLETGSGEREIAMTEKVDVKNGQHYIASRKVVEGGYGV